MSKRKFLGLIAPLFVFLLPAYGDESEYGRVLCENSSYDCVHILRGDSWEKLWPNYQQRRFIMHLNRINTRLHAGMLIAVPRDDDMDLMNYSPLPYSIAPPGRTEIIVDPNHLAWGAYDAKGNLVRWGPASAGRDWCSDLGRGCRTKSGKFTIYDKRGAGCVSSIFPIGRGGAPMPYCMFFHGGMALHGSYEVPGYNDSHSCVRLFPEDAEWLNHEFIDVGVTRVIIKPY